MLEMPDGRMFGMIPGDAGNAGCGFRMPEMLDAGRCLEMPGDAWRCRKSPNAWREPEEPECLERVGRACD